MSTSFAKSVGGAGVSAATSRPAFERAHDPTREARKAAFKAERKGSDMVERDRPQPVLKPSPGLAYETDQHSFNARWDAEKARAKADADKATRKEQFKAARMRSSSEAIAQTKISSRCEAVALRNGAAPHEAGRSPRALKQRSDSATKTSFNHQTTHQR